MQSPKQWYLVETNYDHWKPVPAGDDRRGPANRFMSQFDSSNITIGHLTTLMNTYPNLNGDTTYTTLMRWGGVGY